MGSGLASGLGPWLGGYIFDVWGSYRPAFWLVVAMNLLAVTTVALAIRPSRRGGGPARR